MPPRLRCASLDSFRGGSDSNKHAVHASLIGNMHPLVIVTRLLLSRAFP